MDDIGESLDESPVIIKAEKRSTLITSDMTKNKKGYVAERLDKYRKYIRALDIICAVLIIFGGILSQIENEFYYYDNIFYRVVGVTLMNGILRKPFNHTLDTIMTGVDIVALTDFTGSNQTGLGHNYKNNDVNYTYEDVLNVIDFSSFNYSEVSTEWYSIYVHLNITDLNNRIRWVLFITTMISGNYTLT
jgi:hypothetical protein